MASASGLSAMPGAGPPATARRPVIPNAVLAMVIFIAVEMMFFAGFVSAHTIVKASYPPGTWPPPGQPRLPVEVTAFTTLMLLASGLTVRRAGDRFAAAPDEAGRLLALGIGLGSLFIGIQGFEWARLLGEGLTLQSSPFGSFFYLIVGTHAAHAIPALGALGYAWARSRSGLLTSEGFAAARLFWYFVVLVWPVLYVLVYL